MNIKEAMIAISREIERLHSIRDYLSNLENSSPKVKITVEKKTKRVAWNKGRKMRKWSPEQRAKFIKTMKEKYGKNK